MNEPNAYEIYRYPDKPDSALRGQIEELRFYGHKGGFITKHRALLTSPRSVYKLLSSVGLAVVLLFGWLAIMKWVSALWAGILSFWSEVLGIHGYVTVIHYKIGNVFGFDAAYLHVKSTPPDFVLLIIGAVLTILLLLTSLLLPRRHLPIIYLLRVVALFQACAQIFFTFVPWDFPYGASGYIHGTLIAGLALISLVPILLGLTFFIFDFRLWKRAALALLTMLFLVVFIPIQFTAHAFILYHSSLLFLPILFFVFGLPLDVMIFIAFYSWGSSWRNVLYKEDPPRGNGFYEH
jgi:hypothetical protein